MSKTLMYTLITIIALVVIWHIGFFLLGGVIAITASIWAIIVASIVAFCLAVLSVFILTGLGILILGGAAFVWTVIAIILFPVLFPILAPLFIVLLFIAYLRRRDQRKNITTNNEIPKI